MPSYRRVLAVVDLGRSSREVARKAHEVAVENGARFAIGHVADWGLDLGADDFCPFTPQQIEERLETVVNRQLHSLASQVGAADAATLVSVAMPTRGIGELARRWQPDLVVVDAKSQFGGLEDNSLSVPGWTCDAQVVAVAATGLLSKAARLVAEAVAPGSLCGTVAPVPRRRWGR